MRKYWRIRNDADIEQCLHKLNVDKDYIKIILEEDSNPMLYLNQTPKPDYIYIIYRSDWGWGWDEEYSMSPGYQFCGEINMRKEKLKRLEKINGEYK